MKKVLMILALAIATPLLAQVSVSDWKAAPDQPVTAGDVTLEAFKWQARPLLVFADSPLDPAFMEQLELLQDRMADVMDRDILIITDTDPAAPSDLREKFRPKGFMFVLIGKDGGVKLRKPFPWDVRELSRTIDKMPLRKREISERRAAGSL